MAVSSTHLMQIKAYGRPSEKGGAHGLWVIQGGATGTNTGGNVVMNLSGTSPAQLQGRLFVVRGWFASNADATVRSYRFQSVLDGLNPDAVGSNDVLFTGAGVVAAARATVVVSSTPFVWWAQQSSLVSVMFHVSTVNVDTIVYMTRVWGEYWEESRLRQGGTGPRIRW